MQRLFIPVLYLLLLCFIISAHTTQAQGSAPTALEPALRFTHLTADDGLAQNSVEAILQDSQGFIWIGTQDGLSRFDGYTFTSYKHDPDNPNSLSHNFVRDIFEDHDGYLWIATNGGVNRFDPQTETFTRYQHDPKNPNSLGGNIIFSVFQDSQGIFWFGGPFSGLTRFDPITAIFTGYPPNRNSPHAYQGGGIWQMIEAKSGDLWLAADFLLAKFNPATRQFTSYPVGPNERRLNALYLDAAGNVWGAGTDGLYRLNPQTGQLAFFHPDDSLFEVSSILADENGRFWLASQKGLFLFDLASEQFSQHYQPDPTDPNSLSSSRVTALYRDRAGVMWIGTADHGLNLLDPRQARFTHYRDAPNPTNTPAQKNINIITGDNRGRLWFGTGPLLNQLDLQGQVTAYSPTLPQKEPVIIQTAYLDRAGMVWLGVSSRWLTRFNSDTHEFKVYELPANTPAPPAAESPDGLPTSPPAASSDGLPGAPPPGPSGGRLPGAGPVKSLTSIYQDSTGVLWITLMRDGLYRFDPQRETFQVYQQPDILLPKLDDPHSIVNNELNIVSGDRAGNLWLGYNTIGALSRFDPRTKIFKHYQLGLDQIETIYTDRAGTLWLASRQGLVHFDPQTETFKQYTEKDGLPTSFVVSILEDKAGNFWLGTKKGLARFDPRTETFHTYDVADGLPGNEFNSRAAWQAADGQMFFGGSNGLTAFYPNQIKDNPYQPPVVLTEFRLFNEPVPLGQDSPLHQPIWQTGMLTLNHDQNILTFDFAALSYAASNKNRFRYQLEGFENDWNEVDSTHRTATYTNLPAGDYVFRVQGTNNDGVWSSKEVALNLIILPPWWETTWFRGLMLTLVVGLVYGGYRWRVQAIQSQNRLLEAQVALRTQELTEKTEDLAESYTLLEQEVVERRRVEAELVRAKDAAEAANRAKSAFLANMSHELRSPLNAILGFAQVIARSQTLPPEDQENIDIISHSGEHLLALINQVLDLSKIEAGHVALNEKTFDLYHLLDDLHDQFVLKAEQKGLQLLFEPGDDIPQYIRTDEIKLRQVLINLLNNALKFTEEGGVTLRVGSKGEETSLLPASYFLLLFEVEDTGPGIAPAEMDSLFEAFSQTETGRKTQEGTGLGLSISRKFVQLLGGDISVASEVGRGTIFKVNIRVQPVDNAEIVSLKSKIQNRVIALRPSQPRYRILIVDDNLTNRQLLIKLLNPLGFELREAENGQEAIEIWETFEPHLIWMDMRMPVMDGYQATRHIKATTKGQATAIIALTASSFDEERAVVLSAGCDDFLRKPFRDADIFETMHKHIGVQYIYETNKDFGAQDSHEKFKFEDFKAEIAALPVPLATRLKEATERSDMDLISQAIAEIHDDQHPALAAALAKLANNFEYDKILTLFHHKDTEVQSF